MPTIEAKAYSAGSNPTQEAHILKIMYSETPPNKNYIWGAPDGKYYE